MNEQIEDVEFEETAIVQHQTQAPALNWEQAIKVATIARTVRQEIANDILEKGVDYGSPFEGSGKAVMLKPGAEKITDAFELYSDFTIEEKVERWDNDDPLFYYHIKCYLRRRGTNDIVASGMGSCNIKESKYYWRETKRICPNCGADAIIKGKEEYGGRVAARD